MTWDETIHEPSNGRRFRLGTCVLSDLKPHEKPSSWRVWKIAKAMRSGVPMPLMSVGEDGMILDGHGRYYAARRVLGVSASVPVEVSY